ncbi:MAG: glycine zipper 2TM domain-containing protein [Burkholderiaceae bacterium]
MHSSMRGLIYGAMLASTMAFAAPADARQDGRRHCDACGTVVTTNRKDEKGSGTAGTVIGGVGGAVVGNVAGHNTTSTILGGVGGAIAGNLIGKKMSTKKIWSVRVRMDDGGTQDVDFDRDPGYRQGQRVRVANGTLNRL